MTTGLVLYWHPPDYPMRIAVQEHLEACAGVADEVVFQNAAEPPRRYLSRVDWDVVVLHTLFLGVRWSVYFDGVHDGYRWLSESPATKIAIPQDEYDHSDVLDEWLEELGVDWIFSCFDASHRELLYRRMWTKARFREVLTGYINPTTAAALGARMVPHERRPYDVVYRASALPYWFGSHGQLKRGVGEAVLRQTGVGRLKTDISSRPEDVIFGEKWLEFLMSGRAVTGAESGSSVLDRRGEVQRAIRELLAHDPALSFEEVSALMPSGWDAHRFFAISPRHLEAVVTKTTQVLVEGSYSGVLKPFRHYIPVRSDLSDLGDVLGQLHDRAMLEEIAERAYAEVYVDGVYTTDDFAQELRGAAGSQCRPRRLRRSISLRRATALEKAAELRQRFDAAGRIRAALARASGEAHVGSVGIFAGLRATRGSAGRVGDRLWLVVQGGLSSRWSRRLIALYLARAEWRRVPPRQLARDLLRAGLLERLSAPRAPWSVSRRELESGFLFVSAAAPGDRAVERVSELPRSGAIIWDHSAMGATVPISRRADRRHELILDEEGVYEFVAFERLARRHPELVRKLVRSIKV